MLKMVVGRFRLEVGAEMGWEVVADRNRDHCSTTFDEGEVGCWK